MIFLKCLLVVRTCRRRIADVYPLFKAFGLQKLHVQDAWNCITCLKIKASKTLPLSLSALRKHRVDLRKNCLQPALKTQGLRLPLVNI